MNTYYIYKDNSDNDVFYYKDGYGEMHTSNCPYQCYTLSRNKGKFFGEGNFCGYYAYSGFKGCEVIGETIVNVKADEDEVDVSFNWSAELVQVTPYLRTIADTFTDPIEFKSKNDDKAFEYFKYYVLKKWKKS